MKNISQNGLFISPGKSRRKKVFIVTNNLYLDIFVDVAFPQNNHSETLIIPQSSGLCSSETCTYAGGGLREGFNRGSERADLVMYYLFEYFLRICFGDLGVLSII